MDSRPSRVTRKSNTSESQGIVLAESRENLIAYGIVNLSESQKCPYTRESQTYNRYNRCPTREDLLNRLDRSSRDSGV